MDIAQLAQMVNWLDEEHRRDRAEIARLQQRLESQTADIVEQTRRIQDVEGRLASTQAQLTRFTQIEQALQNTKQEILLLVEREEETRIKAQRELERTRLSDREALGREISEVRRDLPRIGRAEEAIQVRQTEIERLSEMVMGVRNQIPPLNKEIEERTRQIPFLAEQRNSDTKRIAQLQQETVELFKRAEGAVGRISVLEEDRRKVAAEIEKMRPIPGQIREEQVIFMEKTRLQLVDQEQLIGRWQETIEEQKSIAVKVQDRVQGFLPHIEASRRAVQEVTDFKNSLQRDQSQVQELQRLADERTRREIEEFREDYEKRRRKEELRQEHLWQEQTKYNQQIVEKFPAITHNIQLLDALIQRLWRLQESYPTRQLTAAQTWIDGLQQAIKERDAATKAMEEEWLKQRRNTELYTAPGGNTRARTAGVTTGDAPKNP